MKKLSFPIMVFIVIAVSCDCAPQFVVEGTHKDTKVIKYNSIELELSVWTFRNEFDVSVTATSVQDFYLYPKSLGIISSGYPMQYQSIANDGTLVTQDSIKIKGGKTTFSYYFRRFAWNVGKGEKLLIFGNHYFSENGKYYDLDTVRFETLK